MKYKELRTAFFLVPLPQAENQFLASFFVVVMQCQDDGRIVKVKLTASLKNATYTFTHKLMFFLRRNIWRDD